jgi:hypothetical protein
MTRSNKRHLEVNRFKTTFFSLRGTIVHPSSS